jgi:hypothetical protein
MSLNVSRRTAFTALGGAAASFAVQTPVIADPAVVRATVIPIFDVAPMYAASAQGYFTAENMTVTTQAVQTGAVGIPALIAGAYDVAYSNATSVLSGIQQGLDPRIILNVQWMVMRSWVKATGGSFQHAYRRGVTWFDANLGKPAYFDCEIPGTHGGKRAALEATRSTRKHLHVKCAPARNVAGIRVTLPSGSFPTQRIRASDDG